MPVIYTTSLPRETDKLIKIWGMTSIPPEISTLHKDDLKEVKELPQIDITNSQIESYKITSIKGNCELLNIKKQQNLSCFLFEDPDNKDNVELGQIILESMQFVQFLLQHNNLNPDIIKTHDVIAYQNLENQQLIPYIKKADDCYLKLTME